MYESDGAQQAIGCWIAFSGGRDVGDESLPDWESKWRGSPPRPLAQRPASQPRKEDQDGQTLALSLSLFLSFFLSPCRLHGHLGARQTYSRRGLLWAYSVTICRYTAGIVAGRDAIC